MNDADTDLRQRLTRRHLQIGWWGLLLFLSLGIALETLHGFKIGFYLDPANKTRRLLWTLAHAHGALIALINLAFAVSVPHLPETPARRLKLAAFFLLDALILLPLGFFLGGVNPRESDPGIGVLLVPIGALFLFGGVILTAMSTLRRG